MIKLLTSRFFYLKKKKIFQKDADGEGKLSFTWENHGWKIFQFVGQSDLETIKAYSKGKFQLRIHLLLIWIIRNRSTKNDSDSFSTKVV